ncbi:MAG TPA: cytochrome c3 family protein, partial [Anaerolineales bacterium]
AKCHYAIYQKYSTSVHGSALLGQGNPDVPTCIDCHGVHNIGNPSTAAFRLKSPELCAKCHTDPKIMDKYGISTQVLNTYVADFHGTTVTLFQKESADQQTNKPVCFDCHGVHDIKRVDDPQNGLQVKENLLARCKVCHPGASPNFPTAWLSHYIPSPQRYPLVYTVNTFYKFFIPGVLGGMAVLVILDMSVLLRKRLRRARPARPAGAAIYPGPEATPAAPEPEPAPAVPDASQTGEGISPAEAAPPAPEAPGSEGSPVVEPDEPGPAEPPTPPEESTPGEPPEEAPNA